MSRLTASPFHKPSVFDSIPRPPLSPPETQLDSAFTNTATVARGMDSIDTRPIDGLPDPDPQSMSPAARFRKVSTMAYVNSGLREARDRGAQKSSKQFVIVIPPATFQEEHGTLGHTLSSGPSHRHSHGILLPLFPTFYGQVTAIAREWNFPSTAGICLYLQYTDNGVTSTPRISDDTWQFLWSTILDPTAAPSPRPPIVAKVEFDLDLRLARWYSSWLASAHRDSAYEIPASVAPSVAPSEGRSHFRREIPGNFLEDDIPDDHSGITRFSTARPRHVPKKLSLVDRFDATSVRSKAPSRPTGSPPEFTTVTPQHALSPIQQLEEPRSAKQDLATKVMSWRASASHKSHLAAANGQISLDPANMPNSLNIDSPSPESDSEELNLADFDWSISSAGPPSWDSEFEYDDGYSYPPSIHIDRRMQGSVCLTPSTCTSFGPSDSPYSESEGDIYSRVATPDIAYRMMEDCPPSPSICTSFPSFSPPPSPLLFSRPSSIDLGQRNVFSRPATPSTATTWGPPLSYPPSPVTPFYVSTPDIGHRSADIPEVSSATPVMSFPYYDPFQGAVWQHVWPLNVENQGIEASSAAPMSFPYYDASQGSVWQHVWPLNASHATYREDSPSIQISKPPTAKPSRHVSPHREMESSLHSESAAKSKVSTTFSAYPHFQLYPAQYPHNLRCIYPASPAAPQNRCSGSGSLGYPFNLACIYPNIAPHRPQGYPHFDLYPAKHPTQRSTMRSSPAILVNEGVPIKVFCGYPRFELYTPCYPHNLKRIYPEVVSAQNMVTSRTGYPHFELYPSVYPRTVRKVSPGTGLQPSVNVNTSAYPFFVLYPPIFPHNLGQVYPSIKPQMSYLLASQSKQPRGAVLPHVSKGVMSSSNPLTSQYPNFILYAPIYPFNLQSLYPRLLVVDTAPAGVSIRIPPSYPHLEIYRPVYPYNLLSIYPAKAKSVCESPIPSQTFTITQYPHFQLYPKRYPLNLQDIYPRVEQATDSASLTQSRYPYFMLYPSVYPHFDLYPRIQPSMGLPKGRKPHGVTDSASLTSSQYPYFTLYSSVYPHFDLYHRVKPSMGLRKIRKPHAQLHEMVFMNKPLPRRRPLKTHFDLHNAVFPSGLRVSTSSIPRRSTGSPSSISPPNQRPVSSRLSRPPKFPPPAAPLPTPPGPTPAPRRTMSFQQNTLEHKAPSSLSRHSSAIVGPNEPHRHRKRDSLVLQRVRALNSTLESDEGTSELAHRHPTSVYASTRS